MARFDKGASLISNISNIGRFNLKFQSSSFISNATANALLSCGAIDFCLQILKSLLSYWKNAAPEEVINVYVM